MPLRTPHAQGARKHYQGPRVLAEVRLAATPGTAAGAGAHQVLEGER